MKFRKKPVIIEAKELKQSIISQNEICNWCGGRLGFDGGVIIPTLEGDMTANTGDYIIQGVNGEFYPCKPDIFDKTYEVVTDDGQTESN